jgi:hypothetical protein
MLEDKKKYENEVMKIFNELIEKNKYKFTKNHIYMDNPEMEILNLDEVSYTSEVSVYFYIQKELLGVIEFFIFNNGFPEATLEEFQEWFQKEFEYIFQKVEKRIKN